jgi:four helix bundle protein
LEKSYELVLLTYQVTKDFPHEERFGLTSQMRRAVLSVPANIAEGRARRTRPDYLRFLYISRGSLQELLTYMYLAHDLGYLKEASFSEMLLLTNTTSHVLRKLIDGLNDAETPSLP